MTNPVPYFMTRCAKCFTPLDGPPYRTMGNMIWDSKAPCFCHDCCQKWHFVFKRDKSRKGMITGEEWKEAWKKAFEDWLGYEWNPDNPFAIVKVVFT